MTSIFAWIGANLNMRDIDSLVIADWRIRNAQQSVRLRIELGISQEEYPHEP